MRFPIGLYFLLITYFSISSCHGHLLLSISSSAISSLTLCNHVLLGLPTGLLPSTLNYMHFFTQFPSLFLHHMSIPSQPTTSNDSCDRLNSNQLYHNSSLVPSAFHRHTIHPSNHLHLCSLNQHQLATVWSHFTFHPFGEGFWMSEMAKASGTSSHLFLILAVAARFAPPSPSICLPDNNGSLHIPMSLHPPLSPQLNLAFWIVAYT